MKLVFYCNTGLVSALIKWQTRSPYSHVAVLVENNHRPFFVEAWWGGVRKREGHSEDVGNIFDVYDLDLTPEQEDTAGIFLVNQIGKPYDFTMVARFVSRRQASRASRGKWFCSELAFAAARKGGVHLLKNVEPWEVSPGGLSRSPLLTKITEDE